MYKETKDEKNKYKVLMEEHPLLFARRKLPMTQTCMCWGIEAGPGWYQPLRSLCDQLELINLTTGKQFGFVIRAEQVKEKYGTLRFHYNLEYKPPFWRKVLASPFNLLAWLIKVDFKSERVNVGRSAGDDFKNYKTVWHPRFLFWLHMLFRRISTWIEFAPINDHWVAVVHGAVQDTVDKLIADAEKECMDYCEDCGYQIGTDWSPRCETQGWISYICKNCAEKRGDTYSITNDKTGETRFYMGDKDITEEYMEQRKQHEAEMRKHCEEAKKEDKELKKEDTTNEQEG